MRSPFLLSGFRQHEPLTVKFRRTRCSIKTGLYDEAGRVQGGFHQSCLVKERPQLNVGSIRMEDRPLTGAGLICHEYQA